MYFSAVLSQCEDLLLQDGDPVDAAEPAMFFDVVDAILQIAVTLAEVNLQQVPYYVLYVVAEMRRKPHLHKHRFDDFPTFLAKITRRHQRGNSKQQRRLSSTNYSVVSLTHLRLHPLICFSC